MTTLPTAPNEEKKSAERRIPKKVRHAIDLLVTGQAANRKQAADQAGISPEHFYRMLARDHVREYVEARSKRALADLKVVSVGVLHNLVANAESEHVRKDIALKVVGADLAPDQALGVQINITPGYVIDLSGGEVIPSRSAEPAKPLIDREDVTDV